jgi:hypothetical protein
MHSTSGKTSFRFRLFKSKFAAVYICNEKTASKTQVGGLFQSQSFLDWASLATLLLKEAASRGFQTTKALSYLQWIRTWQEFDRQVL